MKKHRSALRILLGLNLIYAASQAYAETPVLPGSVQPAQISRALKTQQPAYVGSVAPAPSLATPPAIPAKLLEQAKKITFKLKNIILIGNTVYSERQLEPLYAHDLGKTISVAELFVITQNITNFYRNNGYILSRAILEPQKVTNGVVKIRVIEGYISNVYVTGNPKAPYGAHCLIQAYGERMKSCPPLQLSRLQNYLQYANEIPGATVKAVFAPSKVGIGGSDLTLSTELKPVTSYFSYDNYGTRYIGPQQMTGNVEFNSTVISGDALQFNFSKTPRGGELTYSDVNYNLPVNTEGARWVIGSTNTHTHPLFVLQPTQIDSTYRNYYTTIFVPVIHSQSGLLIVRGSFNYLNNISTVLDFPLYTDHVRALDGGFTYSFADIYGGSNFISADLKQGLPLFGYTNQTNLNAATSHPGASGNYTKFSFNVNRLQAIKGPFSFYGDVMGQWGFDPLLSSEQFAFGGPIIGRGYDVAELIGDRGIAGTLELRVDKAVNTILISSFELYTFYDWGDVWNVKATGGLPIKLSGTAAGAGIRFSFTRFISGNFMWTQTLTKQVAAEELIGNGRKPRVFFSVLANLD